MEVDFISQEVTHFRLKTKVREPFYVGGTWEVFEKSW